MTHHANVLDLPCRTPVVVNENTLACVGPHNTLTVLAGSVRRGGMDWKNGYVIYSPIAHGVREATHHDFKEYRVDARGFLEAAQ